MQGRKRHIAVDTIGLLLTVLVTAASVQDRDAARPLLWNLRKAFPSVRLAWAGAGYAGKLVSWAKTALKLTLQIVKRPDGAAPVAAPSGTDGTPDAITHGGDGADMWHAIIPAVLYAGPGRPAWPATRTEWRIMRPKGDGGSKTAPLMPRPVQRAERSSWRVCLLAAVSGDGVTLPVTTVLPRVGCASLHAAVRGCGWGAAGGAW